MPGVAVPSLAAVGSLGGAAGVSSIGGSMGVRPGSAVSAGAGVCNVPSSW